MKNRRLKMGKSKFNFGTQIKERARQQKQIDKAAKRMLARQQKKAYTTSPPKTESDITEPISAETIAESAGLPVSPSINKEVN
jgi:hypothetical protein